MTRARRVAYDVLRAVDERDAYANLVLRSATADLDERDAAFATELTNGTLRRQGTLDAVVARVAKRPIDDIDPPVRDVLRLGAYQILCMRTPAHAAVSTSVDLAREIVGEKVAGFVNAVLRKTAARDWDGWVQQIAPAYETDPIGHLSFAYAHPRWIVDAFHVALDGDLEETRQALAADDRAEVHLAALPGAMEREELLAEVDGLPGPFSPYAVRLRAGSPASISAVADRRAIVQDEGSQLVAIALTKVDVSGHDRRWLDMAAGPGGKAALVCALASDNSLVANDANLRRAALVREALSGSSCSHGVVCSDGRQPPWRADTFDRVLLDAPCTGLGALRRRPEARWRRQPTDADRLAVLQRQLLSGAIDACRVGGVVGYVTCSPHLAETRTVVDVVHAARDDIELLDIGAVLPDVPNVGPSPYMQLWPHRHGTDAMFLALLRRR